MVAGLGFGISVRLGLRVWGLGLKARLQGELIYFPHTALNRPNPNNS